MPISVASPVRRRGLAAALAGIVRATLAAEGRRAGEISVVLTHDREIRRLNREWRGIDRATDVLSFGYDDEADPNDDGWPGPPEGPGGLRGALEAPGVPGENSRRSRSVVNGDLVISLDRLEAQARRYRVSRSRELARLVVHGTLHLVGLDHAHVLGRRHMRRREAVALRTSAPSIAALERALRVGRRARNGGGRT